MGTETNHDVRSHGYMAGQETKGRYKMNNKDSALNLIHARMMIQHINNKLEEYLGTPIGQDKDMEYIERHLQAVTLSMVRKIDPEATTDVRMPRINEGGRTIDCNITTRHPEKFGITLDNAT